MRCISASKFTMGHIYLVLAYLFHYIGSYVSLGASLSIDLSPPKYNAEDDLAFIQKALLKTAKATSTNEDMHFKDSIKMLTSLIVEHEEAHLKQFLNEYGSGILKTQLNRKGNDMLNDAKKFLDDMFQNNSVSYNKFLKHIVNYVRENTHFWLFANNINGYEEIVIGEKANISSSKFNSSRPTVILIHGWINAGDNFYSESMIDAFKKYGDYNIISVDWSKLSYTFYTMSRISVNFIGPYVTELIEELVENHSAKLEDIHILGHSLGAHIAGIAGMFMHIGKINRITGFDPASPLFGDDNKYKLDATDANFVVIIHSSLLGVQDNLGHVDIYPNGGGPLQPGCGLYIVCPHRRAYEYYIESMIPSNDQFLAYPCESWLAFDEGNCTQNPIVMGETLSQESRGKYYLRTADESPFALGTRTLLPVRPHDNNHHSSTKKPPKKPNKIWEKFNFLPFFHK